MATLVELHTALQDRLATIDGLRTFNHPPQGGTPPFAYPVLVGGEQEAFSRLGPQVYQFEVVVITAQTVRPQDGYLTLMEYVDRTGPRSVRLAIWDGNVAGSFAGLTHTQAHVGPWRETGVDDFDAYQGYGGIFAVEIHTRGT